MMRANATKRLLTVVSLLLILAGAAVTLFAQTSSDTRKPEPGPREAKLLRRYVDAGTSDKE